jgi:hypothetical protein
VKARSARKKRDNRKFPLTGLMEGKILERANDETCGYISRMMLLTAFREAQQKSVDSRDFSRFVVDEDPVL